MISIEYLYLCGMIINFLKWIFSHMHHHSSTVMRKHSIVFDGTHININLITIKRINKQQKLCISRNFITWEKVKWKMHSTAWLPIALQPADKLSLLFYVDVYLLRHEILIYSISRALHQLIFSLSFKFRTNKFLFFSYVFFSNPFGRYTSRQASKNIRKSIRSENTPYNTPYGIHQVNWYKNKIVTEKTKKTEHILSVWIFAKWHTQCWIVVSRQTLFFLQRHLCLLLRWSRIPINKCWYGVYGYIQTANKCFTCVICTTHVLRVAYE